MELFFDLVYVFAVTQLSHTLVQHLTVRGAVETLVLFLAVWWAWNYTAWATNWIDPDALAVRVMLVVLMILGLVMAACIPSAFEGRALGFAGAYVALQVVRERVHGGGAPRAADGPQLRPAPGVVVHGGGLLDRRRHRRGRRPPDPLGAGPRGRLRRPAGQLLAAPARADADERVDAARRSSRRADAARADHRPRRVDPHHRHRLQRAARRRLDHRGVHRRLPRQRRAVVDLLRPPRRGGRPPRGGRPGRRDPPGPHRLRLRPRDHGPRGDRERRRRRGGDPPSHRAHGDRGRARHPGRSGDLPGRRRALPRGWSPAAFPAPASRRSRPGPARHPRAGGHPADPGDRRHPRARGAGGRGRRGRLSPAESPSPGLRA